MTRRRGGARSVASWLLFWFFWCGCCVEARSNGPGECPARPYRPPELSLRGKGGLSGLVSSAESTRSVVVRGQLPYEFISTRAREAYNGSRPLTASQFVAEWTSHTQNALFVGGFVLFVGVLLPAAAMALWTFCECCYEEDEEEEQENRNLTLGAQVVVWSLAGALLAALVVLLVMVGILLGANSWMSQGVAQGGAIVRRTIPQLVELRESALQSLDDLLIEGYDNLTLDLQTSRLDEIPLEVSKTVSAHHSTPADTLSQSISMFLSERPRLLYNLTVSVATTLSFLHNLTTSLNSSLTSLQRNCSRLTDVDGNSSLSLLSTLCDNFTFDPSSLVPDSRPWNEVGGVSEDDSERSFLSQLQSVLSRGVLSSAHPVPLPRDLLLQYLNEMTQNLSSLINSTSETYFSSLGSNLSLFTEEVALFYNSSLSLSSQPQVELYLGPRHLGNWEWFRSALTITFAIFIFAGCLLLLAALTRGLYFVTAIYRYSDSATYDHGAHQAGMVIKKIAFSLCVISIISALFTGVCLSVAGVMGKACGNHNNFSELLENVVDNPHTWAAGDSAPFYPLAAVLLNMSNYSLRVGDTLSACRSNVSLFRAFHLEQRYDLEDRIWLSPTMKGQYREEMQDIHLELAAAHLSSSEVEVAMDTLTSAAAIPVNWTQIISLSSSSSSSSSFLTELSELQRTLGDIMDSAVSANGSEVASGVYRAADEALSRLNNLLTKLEPPSLSTLTEAASQLNRSLDETTRLSPSISLSLSQLSANVTLATRTKANQLVTQASEMINSQLELYLNSSISNITCSIGDCRALAQDYDRFSRAVCGEVVPGMDLYWSILLITLALSVLLMYLCLLVASRLVNPEMWKLNRKNPKFYLNGAVVRQGYATLWQLAGLSVYLWWIVYLSRNDFVEREYCSGDRGCCRDCIWGFGTLFFIVSALVGGASRVYQYFTIYMIKKCKAMKYRRFWIDRKKAVNFYGELTLVFLQDLPFLILVALSSSELGFLSVPSFYSLSVSLLSILTHLIFLVRQKNNIPSYWTCLKLELNKFGLMKRTYTPNQDPPPSSNGGVAGLPRRGRASVGNGHISVRSPYESSGSDHSENSSQGTFQEHGFEFHPPRLSDIPEYPEGGLDSVGGPGSRPSGGGMGSGLPRIPMLEPHINDDESEMSEQNSQFQSRVRLDRDIELDSEAYLQRRRDAIDNFERGGVEVAPAHYRHRDMDASTISDSYYYGSRNSIELQGYVSSSQVPDYESSDCREEDGDSVFSQARYQLPAPSFMGEVTVDV